MDRLDERMELAGLAHKRYPDVPLLLALDFFLSDRRRAGLGALDERKRNVGGNVNNFKRDVFERGGVVYHLRRYSPERREFAPESFTYWGPSIDAATAIVKTVTIPARDERLCVDVAYRDFQTQYGRRMVASMLRHARRQLRTANNSTN